MGEPITALLAAANGEIYDAPGYSALGRSGDTFLDLTLQDLIPLPEGADLMFLPGRRAVGKNRAGDIVPLDGRPVSAILPAGYTRVYLPAFQRTKNAAVLPLYGYTAVALYRNRLYAAAVHTDRSDFWNPKYYNTRSLKKRIRQTKEALPDNRLVDHLAHCSLEYHCCTAQNLFYRRWEAGIPTSPVCNANCLGCISLQPSECCPSPQERIKFSPTPEEVSAVGIYHLEAAPEAIVSFGQGCEGEPSLAAETIAESIRRIRARTDKGQININTNAGYTAGIRKIIDAGLDSIRVSIISAQEENYAAYYRAQYFLSDVKESIRYALEKKVYVSLNLLYFPGFNDRADESEAWRGFLRELPVQMIQVRNLNLDPDMFWDIVPPSRRKALGTRRFLRLLEDARPRLDIGSFSHYRTK
ncbi:MAG: radical SAM protein [Negativicutes bacterium]